VLGSSPRAHTPSVRSRTLNQCQIYFSYKLAEKGGKESMCTMSLELRVNGGSVCSACCSHIAPKSNCALSMEGMGGMCPLFFLG
jgi:hypothetical protein